MHKPLNPKLKLPRKHTLMQGAHIIMPGSTMGGTRKTTSIITLACVCKLAGLNYIVASYDHYNKGLERSLGNVVVSLDAQSPELARSTLSVVANLARQNHAIILLDIPGSFDSVIMGCIKECCDSLGVIAPISADQWEQECAYSSIELNQPDRVLLSFLKSTGRDPQVLAENLSKYPIWDCERWMTGMKNVFTRSGNYTHLPPAPELAAYLAVSYGKIDPVEELDIEDVVKHFETAAASIYEHLLAPITTVSES